MRSETGLEGWDDFQPPCGLTGKAIQNGDYVVWFPYFITDKEDPFWRYNEWPMLREAFDQWEHKEAFLTRWRESMLTHIVPRVRILINRPDYLVWLAEVGGTSMIALSFLAHGFGLSIPQESWRIFRDLVLETPRRSGEFCLPNNWRIVVRLEENKIFVAQEPPPTFKEGRRDRILLDQLEWEAFKNILRDVGQLLNIS